MNSDCKVNSSEKSPFVCKYIANLSLFNIPIFDMPRDYYEVNSLIKEKNWGHMEIFNCILYNIIQYLKAWNLIKL